MLSKKAKIDKEKDTKKDLKKAIERERKRDKPKDKLQKHGGRKWWQDEEKPSGEKWVSESKTEGAEWGADRDGVGHPSIMQRYLCQTQVIDEER